MFLKTDEMTRNGQTIILFELSALQRISHLEYLKNIEAIEEGDFQKAMEVTVQTGAWVVAMSLWHGHTLKGTLKEGAVAEYVKIQQEVLSTWPLDLIAEADFRVKQLSGMLPPPDEEDVAIDTTAQADDTEPVSAEKSLPVS
ncbi:phage minor tail protein G [Trabulsiella odontotermitis]|uniref:phage tail assembly chaperone G n=1 Tax=Trabulsiella odontotermitis TaxID=379893 RepID=UPI0024B6B609|nr:phage minor tail protein G [Trabulsiella odontotermitis]WHP32838.1 phage minor tail protein G [Trabulsiella odontotermitis]